MDDKEGSSKVSEVGGRFLLSDRRLLTAMSQSRCNCVSEVGLGLELSSVWPFVAVPGQLALTPK